jgi:hypothetical protein
MQMPISQPLDTVLQGLTGRSRRTNLRAVEDGLDSCAQLRKAIEESGRKDFELLCNLNQYTLLCVYDLSTLMHDVVLSIGRDRHKTYARMLAVVLLESVEGITHLLGKDFHEALRKAPNTSQFETQAKVVSKNLNAFKKSNSKILRTIRNIAAAHRDLQADVQWDLIEQLDALQIARAAVKFLGHLNELITLLTMLINELNQSLNAEFRRGASNK